MTDRFVWYPWTKAKSERKWTTVALGFTVATNVGVASCVPIPMTTKSKAGILVKKPSPTAGSQNSRDAQATIENKLLGKLLVVSKGALGQSRAGILSNNGANIISHNGGNIISHNGGNIVSNNGGSIISNNGANYVALKALQLRYRLTMLRRSIEVAQRPDETRTNYIEDSQTGQAVIEYASKTGKRLVLLGRYGVALNEVEYSNITKSNGEIINEADQTVISQDENGFVRLALEGHVVQDNAGNVVEFDLKDGETFDDEVGSVHFEKYHHYGTQTSFTATFVQLGLRVEGTSTSFDSIANPDTRHDQSELVYSDGDGKKLFSVKEEFNIADSGQVSRRYDLLDGYTMNLSTTEIENSDNATFTGTASYQGQMVANVSLKNNRFGIPTFTVAFKDKPDEAKTVTYDPARSSSAQANEARSAADVMTLAGQEQAGYADGNGPQAAFNSPRGITLALNGDLLVADHGNGKMRRITPTGVVSTVVEKFPDIKGLYVTISAVAVNQTGATFFADGIGSTVFHFQPADRTFTYGSGIGYADTAPGQWPKFSQPNGIVSNAENVVYVADTMNHRIRVISSDQLVSTLAGSGQATFSDGIGTAAAFDRPIGIALDNQGNVIVADAGNNRIRKLTPSGLVTTIAGSGAYDFLDGSARDAAFRHPSGVAIDRQDNIYVADTENHRIRKIGTDGTVSTVAGSGVPGLMNGDPSTAQFKSPFGLAIDDKGNLYVSERDNNTIRKIRLQP